MHQAILLIGSNIAPLENLPASIKQLREFCQVFSVSPIWETQAIGTLGPNFLNAAVQVMTGMESDVFKWQALRTIENRLGRVRSDDKNAPRTIDIDIIIWDHQVMDDSLWTQAHIALPVSALVSELVQPGTGKTLNAIAQELCEKSQPIEHPDIP
ncbi:MAG TPA: 2-amino-4-hydroxy-6-hydroxymethyldihydropteridine diphosphokinase [Longilinea sp.]|nr:2-amino-4-hydroxy-6-hydroxymethyldihydropteridine diphosphokinase [Longilinea sp.]